MSNLNLEQCYQILNLEADASADEVQQAYLKELARLRREGKKNEKAQLTAAYNQLLEYTQGKAYNQGQASPELTLNGLINQRLNPYKLEAKVKIKDRQLRIIFDANIVSQKQISPTLIRQIIANLDLANLEIVKAYGMRDKMIAWKQELSLKSLQVENVTENLLKEAERTTNLYAYPIALIIALSLNFTGLSWLWTIWVHEFGHATLAWFSGYRAIPTLALTVMSTRRSLFVYLGILFLIGLLFWSGRKEKQPWAMGLAIFLALLQFYLTWILPRDTYEMLQAFAGVGGEFYLSTFLMVSFYFHLPARLYWEFWRYPALLVGCSTLLDNLWKWHRISQGKGAIPWGTFWGGSDAAGDMDILQMFGWSQQQIINTYTTLGTFCLWIVIGIYIYITMKQVKLIRLK